MLSRLNISSTPLLIFYIYAIYLYFLCKSSSIEALCINFFFLYPTARSRSIINCLSSFLKKSIYPAIANFMFFTSESRFYFKASSICKDIASSFSFYSRYLSCSYILNDYSVTVLYCDKNES